MTKYTYYNIRLASSKRAMTSRMSRGRYSDTAYLTSRTGFLSKRKRYDEPPRTVPDHIGKRILRI